MRHSSLVAAAALIVLVSVALGSVFATPPNQGGNSQAFLPLLGLDATPTPTATATPTPGPTAPTIANPSYVIVAVNSQESCGRFGEPYATAIRLIVDYTDPNGDVVTPDARFYVNGRALTSFTITGNGYFGTVYDTLCARFGSATAIQAELYLWDAFHLESNRVTLTIPRPAGSNIAEGAPALFEEP